MLKRVKEVMIGILLTFILIFVILFFISSPQMESMELGDNYVVRVIDGDTFVLASGESVRLICIDAPEIDEENYEESREYLEFLVLGQEVNLEKDVSDSDEYGRLLRYAYFNGTFINQEMVRNGFASVFRYGEDVSRCDEIAN